MIGSEYLFSAEAKKGDELKDEKQRKAETSLLASINEQPSSDEKFYSQKKYHALISCQFLFLGFR